MVTSKKLTLSTLFTLFRIILVPFIGHGIIYRSWALSCILFIIAAITDVIDGALARFLNERTILGTYLDPLADKILILSCYVSFATAQLPHIFMPWWFIGVLSIKELLLVGGALWCKIIKKDYHVQPTLLGKATMVLQTIFVSMLFVCLMTGWDLQKELYVLLWIIISLSLVTFIDYGRRLL